MQILPQVPLQFEWRSFKTPYPGFPAQSSSILNLDLTIGVPKNIKTDR